VSEPKYMHLCVRRSEKFPFSLTILGGEDSRDKGDRHGGEKMSYSPENPIGKTREY